MVNVTIRDVPHETRDVLAGRAARAGQSLQQYMRELLVDLADRATQDEALDRIRERREREGTLDLTDDIVTIIRQARGA